ncbi:plasmid stabilization protein [Inquilinus limosus]|uniref:Plasmid stabilization protein n=2 Tax=Inquilinus limosus TaxID=171674 RepID=A0A211ZLL6_9PROT|nr:plasmid stabilization protein [Inquilinus limosus]
MQSEIVFSPEARDDLLNLYHYIAEHSGADRAIGYLDRIEAFCRSLSMFPERGTPRDDLFPGLRVVGFERRVAIAFHIDPGKVTIDRILYGGRDLGLLKPPAAP